MSIPGQPSTNWSHRSYRVLGFSHWIARLRDMIFSGSASEPPGYLTNVYLFCCSQSIRVQRVWTSAACRMIAWMPHAFGCHTWAHMLRDLSCAESAPWTLVLLHGVFRLDHLCCIGRSSEITAAEAAEMVRFRTSSRNFPGGGRRSPLLRPEPLFDRGVAGRDTSALARIACRPAHGPERIKKGGSPGHTAFEMYLRPCHPCAAEKLRCGAQPYSAATIGQLLMRAYSVCVCVCVHRRVSLISLLMLVSVLAWSSSDTCQVQAPVRISSDAGLTQGPPAAL